MAQWAALSEFESNMPQLGRADGGNDFSNTC